MLRYLYRFIVVVRLGLDFDDDVGQKLLVNVAEVGW